ncbi:transcriptional repressor brinker [Lycorma delicatula]|uniref:transcriptional repressor brinker n=1 Tax=Lycorma delicatula TaxID=130591 RepID=UPI003F514E80
MAHGVNQEWGEDTSPPSSVKRITVDGKKPIKSEGKVMGSRRIFSPQFKLQVLDSYRHDSDCKGNQRATARKYGIHRRQIQKWLQMESHLRSTVEDTAASESTALNLSSPRQRDVEEPCRTGCLVQADPAPIPEPSSSPREESDVEINVDGNSSSEEDFDDDNSSSTSTYGQTDQALDFTCAALSKRRFFSTEFKLGVLDAFYNDQTCTGNQRATARKFGINRRQIQKWLQQEPLLRGECLDLSCKKRKLNDNSPPPPTINYTPPLPVCNYTPPPPCNYTPPPSLQTPPPPPPLQSTVVHEVMTTATCCSMDLYYRPQWCFVPTYDSPPPPWPYPHPVYLPAVERPQHEQDLKCFRHQTLLHPPSTNEIKVYSLYR